MSSIEEPLDACPRFPEVTLSREHVETALRVRFDRFESSRRGSGCYAQLNLAEGSSWDDLVSLVDRIGPTVVALVVRGEIGRPEVDAAVYLRDDMASASFIIPFAAALAIGRAGFDVKVSTSLSAAE